MDDDNLPITREWLWAAFRTNEIDLGCGEALVLLADRISLVKTTDAGPVQFDLRAIQTRGNVRDLVDLLAPAIEICGLRIAYSRIAAIEIDEHHREVTLRDGMSYYEPAPG